MDSYIPEAVFASYLVRIKVNDHFFENFIGFIITSEDYRNYILNNAEVSAQPQANAKLMTKLFICLPPKSMLSNFNSALKDIQNSQSLCRVESSKLIKIQSLLLSKMAGNKIRINQKMTAL